MEKKSLISKIDWLTQLDVNAAIVYDQANHWLHHQDLQNTFKQFLAEHQQHIILLKQAMRSYDHKVCHYQLDLKGLCFKMLLAYYRCRGAKGILKVLQINEQMISRGYEKILRLDLPSEIKSIVVGNYEDEQRHLAYISEAMKQKLWLEKRILF